MFTVSDEVLVVYCGVPVERRRRARQIDPPLTSLHAVNAGSHCKLQQGQLLSLGLRLAQSGLGGVRLQ